MAELNEQPKIDDLKRLLRRLEQVNPEKEQDALENGASSRPTNPPPLPKEAATTSAATTLPDTKPKTATEARVTPDKALAELKTKPMADMTKLSVAPDKTPPPTAQEPVSTQPPPLPNILTVQKFVGTPPAKPVKGYSTLVALGAVAALGASGAAFWMLWPHDFRPQIATAKSTSSRSIETDGRSETAKRDTTPTKAVEVAARRRPPVTDEPARKPAPAAESPVTQPNPPKPEPAKPEAAKPEAAKPEAAKPEATKPDPKTEVKDTPSAPPPAEKPAGAEKQAEKPAAAETTPSAAPATASPAPLEESAVMHAPAAPFGRDKYESEARLDAYLERGQRMIDEGDLTGARSFFRRVAESGDPRGALAMGATYDANYFAELGIRGVNPDNALAGDWYRKAMDLGSKDALGRLERLTQ